VLKEVVGSWRREKYQGRRRKVGEKKEEVKAKLAEVEVGGVEAIQKLTGVKAERLSGNEVKENKKTGFKSKKFTSAEDDVIRAAMNAEGKVDNVKVGKQLLRGSSSVRNRAELLNRTGGMKAAIRQVSLAEDLTILETLILPKLNKTKLSKITIGQAEVCDLARQLGREVASLTHRWSYSLQPMLLQHYTGTLNLRVERMLANHIAENYRD